MNRISAIILSVLLTAAVTAPAAAARRHRGVVQSDALRTPIVLKGQWGIGGSASFGVWRADDLKSSVIDAGGLRNYNLSLRPSLHLALADNLVAGVTPFFSRRFTDISDGDIFLMDTALTAADYRLLSNGYGLSLFIRKYMMIGNSGRFSIYADGTAGYSGKVSKVTDVRGDDIPGTYSTSNSFSIGVDGGIAVKFTEFLTITAGVDVAGISINSDKQVHNQVKEGSRTYFDASYKLNPLALSVGTYFYF